MKLVTFSANPIAFQRRHHTSIREWKGRAESRPSFRKDLQACKQHSSFEQMGFSWSSTSHRQVHTRYGVQFHDLAAHAMPNRLSSTPPLVRQHVRVGTGRFWNPDDCL